MRVIAIYDNLGKTLDRYTVFTDQVDKHPSGDDYRDQFVYLGMSEGGDGFSQWGFVDRANFATLLKKTNQDFRAVTHIGRLVPFEKLSAATQSHIARRVLTEEV